MHSHLLIKALRVVPEMIASSGRSAPLIFTIFQFLRVAAFTIDAAVAAQIVKPTAIAQHVNCMTIGFNISPEFLEIVHNSFHDFLFNL